MTVARAFFWSAIVYLALGMAGGLVYSLHFVQQYPWPDTLMPLSAGWRTFHTQAVVAGFVLNGLAGVLMMVVARGERWSPRFATMGWVAWLGWQLCVVGGLISSLAGVLRPVPWFEHPPPFDLVGAAVWGGLACLTVVAATLPLSVMMAVTVAFAVYLFPVVCASSFETGSFETGTQLVLGLLLPLLGWTLVMQAARGRGRDVRVLAAENCLAGLFLGIHLLRSLTTLSPDVLSLGAASVEFGGGVVWLVMLIVLWQRLRGLGHGRFSPLVRRWLGAGTCFGWFAAGLLILNAIPGFHAYSAFSDWATGFAHLVVFAVLGFWVWGMILHGLLPDLGTGGERVPTWAETHYWLSFVGIAVMVLDLLITGIVQGAFWQEAAPWSEMLIASMPGWLTRSLAGCVLLVGHGFVFAGLFSRLTHPEHGAVGACDAPTRGSSTVETPRPQGRRTVGWAVGIFCLVSVVLMVRAWFVIPSAHNELPRLAEPGLAPAFVRMLERFPDALGEPPHSGSIVRRYRDALARGAWLYQRHQCWHCHTGVVRDGTPDVAYWPAVADGKEGRGVPFMDLPIGHRRVGPDLSRAAGRRSNDWHWAHLQQSAAVVPVSVMPAQPWVWDDANNQPTPAGCDLVIYLQSLGFPAMDQGQPFAHRNGWSGSGPSE